MAIKLAASYIDATGAVDFNYGHFQLVFGDQEIEVQSPRSFTDLVLGVDGFVFEELPRSHSGTTTSFGDPLKYEAIDLDLGDRQAADVWELLKSMHASFIQESTNYLYGLGQNSNSYVNTLMWMIGIDLTPALVEQVQPEQVTGPTEDALAVLRLTAPGLYSAVIDDDDALNPFPGFDRNVLTDGYSLLGAATTDLTIAGTEGDDFTRTGNGDDIIALDSGGSDTVIAGDGIDKADYSNASGNVFIFSIGNVMETSFLTEYDVAAFQTETIVVDDRDGDVSALVSIGLIDGSGQDDVARLVSDSNDIFGFDTDYAIDLAGEGARGDILDLSDLNTSPVSIAWSTPIGQTTSNVSVGLQSDFGVKVNVYGVEHLIGTSGADQIQATGDNNLIAGGASADVIDGREGRDYVYFADEGGPVTVNFSTGTGTGGHAEGDTYTDIEGAVGTSGDDTFIATRAVGTSVTEPVFEYFAGGDGNDTFFRAKSGLGSTSDAAIMVAFGGGGADTYVTGRANTHVLVVQVNGLTEDNFHEFDVASLDLGSSFDWSLFDMVVLNPTSEDKFERVSVTRLDNFYTADRTAIGDPGPEEETVEYLSYSVTEELDSGYGVFSTTYLGSQISEVWTRGYSERLVIGSSDVPASLEGMPCLSPARTTYGPQTTSLSRA